MGLGGYKKQKKGLVQPSVSIHARVMPCFQSHGQSRVVLRDGTAQRPKPAWKRWTVCRATLGGLRMHACLSYDVVCVWD